MILEQGDPLQMIQLLQSPWEDRFRVSRVYFQQPFALFCARSPAAPGALKVSLMHIAGSRVTRDGPARGGGGG